jgi:hypothetical protein
MTRSWRDGVVLLAGFVAFGTAMAAKPHAPPVDLFPAMPVTRPDAQTVLGHSEHVAIMDGQNSLEVTGDLDPRQDHSTLYVDDMKYYVSDGDMWVSFVVNSGTVLSGKRLTLQRKVLRDQHVKERGGGIMHRPWVEVSLCLGKHLLPVTLALADRSAYTAQLRLGRGDIDKVGRVDPALQFTAQPDCPPPAAPEAPDHPAE